MPSTTSELHHLLNNGPRSAFQHALGRFLESQLFSDDESLSYPERAALAYRRLAALRRRFPITRVALTEEVQTLFDLHDLCGLVDGTMTTALSIHYNLALGCLLENGGPEHADYVSELESMASVGVFLATELGYGNNVINLETEAVYDRQAREFVLNTPSMRAAKYMPNTTGAGDTPKLAVVMAKLLVDGISHGVFPFVVRIRTREGLCPGIKVTPLGEKPGYALDNAMTSFHHVRIPKRNLLLGTASRLSDDGVFSSEIAGKRQRFLTAMDRVQSGKVCLTSSAVALARAALFITVTYARQRLTFAPSGKDVPIFSYRSYQRAILRHLAATYAATFFVNHTKDLCLGRVQATKTVMNREIAAMKALCTQTAVEVLSACRERCGAQGLFARNRITPYLNQAHGIVTAEGDNEVILVKIAREMLLGVEYAPPIAEAQGGGGELSDEALIALFRTREAALHKEVVGAMQAELGAGVELHAAWNQHINLALAMARAYAARRCIETFHSRVEACEEPAAKALLRALFRLYALDMLERDAAWFVAHADVTATCLRQAAAESERLAVELAAAVTTLIDAFQMSNELLRTPIATPDYIAAHAEMHNWEDDALAALRLGA